MPAYEPPEREKWAHWEDEAWVRQRPVGDPDALLAVHRELRAAGYFGVPFSSGGGGGEQYRCSSGVDVFDLDIEYAASKAWYEEREILEIWESHSLRGHRAPAEAEAERNLLELVREFIQKGPVVADIQRSEAAVIVLERKLANAQVDLDREKAKLRGLRVKASS